MENYRMILKTFNIPHSCFQYLSLRNELEDLQSGIQRVFTEEIANVKSQSLWQRLKGYKSQLSMLG